MPDATNSPPTLEDVHHAWLVGFDNGYAKGRADQALEDQRAHLHVHAVEQLRAAGLDR